MTVNDWMAYAYQILTKPMVAKMKKSKMETEEFLTPFLAMLQVSKYQHMVYQDGDLGPFFKTDNHA
jgi:hypothetical protein